MFNITMRNGISRITTLAVITLLTGMFGLTSHSSAQDNAAPTVNPNSPVFPMPEPRTVVISNRDDFKSYLLDISGSDPSHFVNDMTDNARFVYDECTGFTFYHGDALRSPDGFPILLYGEFTGGEFATDQAGAIYLNACGGTIRYLTANW